MLGVNIFFVLYRTDVVGMGNRDLPYFLITVSLRLHITWIIWDYWRRQTEYRNIRQIGDTVPAAYNVMTRSNLTRIVFILVSTCNNVSFISVDAALYYYPVYIKTKVTWYCLFIYLVNQNNKLPLTMTTLISI